MISAIVVLYGASPEFAALLASIQQSAPDDFELIVVVNPAVEDPPAIPDWVDRVIVNEYNVGYGQAVNQAALVATGELLLLLNSDVVLPDNWAEELSRPMLNESVGATVPTLIDPDGTIQEMGSFVGPLGETVAMGRGIALLAGDNPCEQIVDYASAACMLVRADAFAAVGGFHPAYGIGYFEDVELSFTFRTHQLHTYLVPSVRVVHVREASFGGLAQGLMDHNRKIFVERWADELLGRPALTDFDRRPYRLTHARDWHRPIRVLAVFSDAANIWQGWPEMADMNLDLAVDVVCGEKPAQMPSGVRYLGSSLADWCSTHRFWASHLLFDGGIEPDVVSAVVACQGSAEMFVAHANETLISALNRLPCVTPG